MIRRSKEKGFSLIEVLVVVAVIGILAAVALPQFSAYRQRANNTAALADIKNFRICIESSHEEQNLYPLSVAGGETLSAGSSSTTPGLTYSPSFHVVLWYESGAEAYLTNSWHKNGTKQFGSDQKNSVIYVAPGIAPLHGTLADHLSANQVWPVPWEML